MNNREFYMQFGTLAFKKIDDTSLLAAPTRHMVKRLVLPDNELLTATIDPTLSDTAAFCEQYQTHMSEAANCVIVEAKRGDQTWYAACLILATDRADINGVVRKLLGARKLSFAPMETATSLTHMEFGGITPVGLPSEWPIFIDQAVVAKERVIIGSGVRASKILITTKALQKLPHATVADISKHATK